jgi:threonine dehydrogenase-like Zn-dependent dehydrogenase
MAPRVLDPISQDVDKELRKCRKIGADVVFEAAGKSDLQARSVYYARKGGTVVWFGCSPVGSKIEINPYDINDAEISVRGSFNNPLRQPGRSIAWQRESTVDNLISHHIGIADYPEVLRYSEVLIPKLMVGMD